MREKRKEVLPAMPKQRTAPDTGAVGIDASAAPAGRPEGPLSRSVILHAALSIIDRDGIDALSMRRLSEQVRRDPTVLYRHVPSKAALLDGVVEIVLGQLRVDTADADWAGQLRTVAHEFRRLALAHPNVVALLVTRPLATPLGQRLPGMLRPLEDVLALLTGAGFSGADALHIYRVLFGYLHGHLLTEFSLQPDQIHKQLIQCDRLPMHAGAPSAVWPPPDPGDCGERTRAAPVQEPGDVHTQPDRPVECVS